MVGGDNGDKQARCVNISHRPTDFIYYDCRKQSNIFQINYFVLIVILIIYGHEYIETIILITMSLSYDFLKVLFF